MAAHGGPYQQTWPQTPVSSTSSSFGAPNNAMFSNANGLTNSSGATFNTGPSTALVASNGSALATRPSDEDICILTWDGFEQTATPQQLSDTLLSITEDPDCSFEILFTIGHDFRMLVEYLVKASKEVPWRLTQDEITMRAANSDGSIINDLRIKTKNLHGYRWSSVHPEIILNVDMEQLKARTKIDKKLVLRLYKLRGDTAIHIQQIPDSNTIPSEYVYMGTLRSQRMPIIQLPVFKRDEPNCKALAVKFKTMCVDFGKVADANVLIIAYEHGILFKITVAGSNGEDRPYGQTPQTCDPSGPQPVQISSMIIKSSAFKDFNKIHSVSTCGDVWLYMEPGTCLKMRCHTNIYAKTDIYFGHCGQ